MWRPRRGRGILRPELFPRRAAAPAVLQSTRARLRARDQEAAGVLGKIAQGAGRGMKAWQCAAMAALFAMGAATAHAAEPITGRWAADLAFCESAGDTTARSP